jgi:adenine-specific DNA-methyltransferase
MNNISSTKAIYETKISKNKPLLKWSNAILSDQEMDMIQAFSSKYITINEIGDISPGIVTGANSFFIVDKGFKERYLSDNWIVPIISKSKEINKGIVFTEHDINELIDSNKKVFLMNLDNIEIKDMPNGLQKYLKIGEEKKIHTRYKCSKRKPWYKVPIVKNGDIFFFKRFHVIPRIAVNEAETYTTDMCYNIRLKDEYDKYSIAFCFYNSLTLTLCEYFGRFYGGGVCELTPKEFKSISIPYKKIDRKYIVELDRMIKEECEINTIVEFVDKIVFMDLNDKKLIELVKIIRNRFIKRRIV